MDYEAHPQSFQLSRSGVCPRICSLTPFQVTTRRWSRDHPLRATSLDRHFLELAIPESQENLAPCWLLNVL